MRKIISLILCCIVAFGLVGCKKFDSNYGKEDKKEMKLPTIKSDDSVMPIYIDISKYDEENYADICLGEDFEYNVTYCGDTINVPVTYEEFTAQGWKLVETEQCNEHSQISVGKTFQADFVKIIDEQSSIEKRISAVFYNADDTAISLQNGTIVRFAIKENVLLNAESLYGNFSVNGVTNSAAITDIVEILGAPSHFYKVAENKYYLDWFITLEDRRSEITIYVDTAEDHIDAVEFSRYE